MTIVLTTILPIDILTIEREYLEKFDEEKTRLDKYYPKRNGND